MSSTTAGTTGLREGRDVVRATKEYAVESRWRSWWHLLSTFGVFAGVAAIICLNDAWYVRLPASFVLGLVAVRIFILYHDFEHGTILARSPLATLILKVYGLFILSPPSIWRRSHDHHHRHNAKIYGASIGSYPVMTPSSYMEASRGERIGYILSRHPLTIAFGYLSVFLWGMCIRSLIYNPRLHIDSAVSLVLHGALIATLAFFSPILMLYLVILPMGVGAALGAYLFYAQHNFPGVELRSREDWDYAFAALNSSSFIRMGPVMRWMTGDIGYHHVHHLNARIPFYRLSEAMDGIEELQSPKTTSLSIRDVYRCLSLKLWDPVKNRMVSFREGLAKHESDVTPSSKESDSPASDSAPPSVADAPSAVEPETNVPADSVAT